MIIQTPRRMSLLFQLRVQLADKPLAGRSWLRHFRVEIHGQLCSRDVLKRFPFLYELRNAVPQRQDHVAMGGDKGTIHGGAVTGNDLRVWSGKSDREPEAIQHSLEAATVGAVNIGISDR